MHGGLRLVAEAYGIVGCFKLVEGFYLLLCTKRRCVGTIAGAQRWPAAAPACQSSYRPVYTEAAPAHVPPHPPGVMPALRRP